MAPYKEFNLINWKYYSLACENPCITEPCWSKSAVVNIQIICLLESLVFSNSLCAAGQIYFLESGLQTAVYLQIQLVIMSGKYLKLQFCAEVPPSDSPWHQEKYPKRKASFYLLPTEGI